MNFKLISLQSDLLLQCYVTMNSYDNHIVNVHPSWHNIYLSMNVHWWLRISCNILWGSIILTVSLLIPSVLQTTDVRHNPWATCSTEKNLCDLKTRKSKTLLMWPPTPYSIYIALHLQGAWVTNGKCLICRPL